MNETSNYNPISALRTGSLGTSNESKKRKITWSSEVEGREAKKKADGGLFDRLIHLAKQGYEINTDFAIWHFEEALKLNVDIDAKCPVWLQLGDAYMRKQQDAKAIGVFRKALARHQPPMDRHHTYVKLGYCYSSLENHSAAIKAWSEALEFPMLEGPKSRILRNMAISHQELGEWPSAIKLFKEALECKEISDADRAMCLEELQKSEKHAREMQRGIAI